MSASKATQTADGMRAAAHFQAPPRASSQAAEAALALGTKLGCRSAVLVGCVREPIVKALGSLHLVGLDSATVIAEARSAGARGKWSELDSEALTATQAATDALLVLDARLALEADGLGNGLRGLLAVSPAAVLLDPDGGFGLDALGALTAAVDHAGLKLEHCSVVRSPEAGSVARLSPYVVISDGHDQRPAHVLAAGAQGLATDPQVDLAADLGRPLRVCIASYEVIGPTRNGGIGTANSSLARALARAGHHVTLLFTGFPAGPLDEAAWVRHYQRAGINFAVLGHGLDSWVRAPHANVRRAYEFYAWLKQQAEPFDVVHFPECQGHAYYAVLARHQGLSFQDTLFVAGVHSSTRWCEEANREVPRSVDALVDDHLERTSVELADVVISPSAYMLDYMREREWGLPQRRFVQQYVLPARRRDDDEGTCEESPIRELLFFGRLEVRKGVETFCDALDLLAEEDSDRDLRITFLGRPEHIVGEPSVDYLERRAQAWPWMHEVLGSLGHDEAMIRLKQGGCLVVMPSTVDNSPNTVSEALGLGVPLICSRSGGTGELIDPRDLLEATFPGLVPDVGLPPPPAYRESPPVSGRALYERIRAGLECPIVPRFAIDHEVNERVHVQWNVGATVAHASASLRDVRVVAGPSISVGILHRDQPRGLAATLEALAAQRGELIDVTVVDDNSVTEEGLRQLARAERLCAPLGWQVIRRRHQHAAEARAQIVANGRGDAFVFSNCSASILDGALRTVGAVMGRTGADVVTCAMLASGGEAVARATPDDNQPSSVATVVPVAGPPVLGLLYPAFADGLYAVSREAIVRLGGFAADAKGTEADVDLLSRALLAGCKLQVVPEPLGRVMHPDAWESVRRSLTIDMVPEVWDREALLRIARPFSIIAPSPLLLLPALYASLYAQSGLDRAGTHRRVEYIGYLENEHRLLSARVHALEAKAPPPAARRVGRRLRRLGAGIRPR